MKHEFDFEDGRLLFQPHPATGWPRCVDLSPLRGHFLRVFAVNQFDADRTELDFSWTAHRKRNVIHQIRTFSKLKPVDEGPASKLWQYNQCLPVAFWLGMRTDELKQHLIAIVQHCKHLSGGMLGAYGSDQFGRLKTDDIPEDDYGLLGPAGAITERVRLLIDSGEPQQALEVLRDLPDEMPQQPDSAEFWGHYQRAIAFKLIGETNTAVAILNVLRRQCYQKKRGAMQAHFRNPVSAAIANQLGESFLNRYESFGDNADLVAARTHFNQALKLYTKQAFSHRLAFVVANLAACARLGGEPAKADALLQFASDVYHEFGLIRYRDAIVETLRASPTCISWKSESELREFMSQEFGNGQLKPWMIRERTPPIEFLSNSDHD
ncbi:MAG: hypothetical protein KDA88_07965 [Planctomycetaceae bacterium]|nr:hypothetical protein [Planctomycetaceae bacterium]MCB9953624.1 hypothetical protein [Planctomycetaceae bacterium]